VPLSSKIKAEQKQKNKKEDFDDKEKRINVVQSPSVAARDPKSSNLLLFCLG